jgi:hypothetical protein
MAAWEGMVKRGKIKLRRTFCCKKHSFLARPFRRALYNPKLYGVLTISKTRGINFFHPEKSGKTSERALVRWRLREP